MARGNRDYSILVIKNGFAAMLFSLFSGFVMIFSMLGGISLSPIPVLIDVTIPGTPDGWRVVHVGMMLNGVMAVAIGCASSVLSVHEVRLKKVVWGTVIAVWGNCMFYLFGMFAPNRGVTLEGNSLGEFSMSGALAFIPAFIGALTLIYAVYALLATKTD